MWPIDRFNMRYEDKRGTEVNVQIFDLTKLGGMHY